MIALKKSHETIATLDMSGFTMSITNNIVQVVCNANLQQYGGAIYISVMGVFLAELISDFVGGLLYYGTMWISIYRKLPTKCVL